MLRCTSTTRGFILAAAFVLTGCSATGDAEPNGHPASQPASTEGSETGETPPPSSSAPRAFNGTPVPITLPALDANQAGDFTSRFLLSGDRAYGVTRTSVGAVDLTTGQTLWETRFPNASTEVPSPFSYNSRGPGSPVLSEDGSTLFAALVVEIPGSGTTSESFASQLIAIDADTGELTWSADIPEGPEVQDTTAQSVHVMSVADDRVVVVRKGDIVNEGTVGAVDTISHQLLWSRPGNAFAVTPDAVILTAETAKANDANYPQLTGLDPVTGDVLWSGDDLETAVVGLHAVWADDGLVVTVAPYSGASPVTGVLDPATGKVTRRLPGVVLHGPVRDGDAIYDVTSHGLRALDPASVEPVWELPHGDRISPDNPVFFGGLVYGQVSHGKSVILDGATGEDVAADITGTFIHVNELGALMLIDRGLVFVPATG